MISFGSKQAFEFSFIFCLAQIWFAPFGRSDDFDWNVAYGSQEKADAAFSKAFKISKDSQIVFRQTIEQDGRNPQIIAMEEDKASVSEGYFGCAIVWADIPRNPRDKPVGILPAGEAFKITELTAYKNGEGLEHFDNGIFLKIAPAIEPAPNSAAPNQLAPNQYVEALQCRKFYEIDDLEYTGRPPYDYNFKNFTRAELDALLLNVLSFVNPTNPAEK